MPHQSGRDNRELHVLKSLGSTLPRGTKLFLLGEFTPLTDPRQEVALAI